MSWGSNEQCWIVCLLKQCLECQNYSTLASETISWQLDFFWYHPGSPTIDFWLEGHVVFSSISVWLFLVFHLQRLIWLTSFLQSSLDRQQAEPIGESLFGVNQYVPWLKDSNPAFRQIMKFLCSIEISLCFYFPCRADWWICSKVSRDLQTDFDI